MVCAGNAILSRFPISNVQMINYPDIVQGYPRSTLRATVNLSSTSIVRVYSVHLEVCCGISDRISQFSRVLDDVREWDRSAPVRALSHTPPHTPSPSLAPSSLFDLPSFLTSPPGTEGPVLIAGDFNTIAHGWLRFSPFHCTDAFRFLSLCETEPDWWQRNLFTADKHHSAWMFPALVKEWSFGTSCAFFDPFDTNACTSNHTEHPCKMDWMLLRGFPDATRLIAERAAKSDGKPNRPNASVCRAPHRGLVLAEIGEGKESDHRYLLADIAVNFRRSHSMYPEHPSLSDA